MSEKGCPFCGSVKSLIKKGKRQAVRKGEYTEVYWVQCYDCGARGSEHGSRQKAVDAWETRRSSWIPAIIQLPEKLESTGSYPFSDAVLVATLDEVTIGVLEYPKKEWFYSDDLTIRIRDVKCWMPLPIPPEEKLKW